MPVWLKAILSLLGGTLRSITHYFAIKSKIKTQEKLNQAKQEIENYKNNEKLRREYENIDNAIGSNDRDFVVARLRSLGLSDKVINVTPKSMPRASELFDRGTKPASERTGKDGEV